MKEIRNTPNSDNMTTISKSGEAQFKFSVKQIESYTNMDYREKIQFDDNSWFNFR